MNQTAWMVWNDFQIRIYGFLALWSKLAEQGKQKQINKQAKMKKNKEKPKTKQKTQKTKSLSPFDKISAFGFNF